MTQTKRIPPLGLRIEVRAQMFQSEQDGDALPPSREERHLRGDNGRGWGEGDGYFLLFQESGQYPVEDETCVELRVAAFYSLLVFSTGAREAAQNPAALPMTISLQEHGPRNRTA